ncbi:MAG: hypothetical protein AC479_03930 [miscellaneous Crenarchaeota group-6 archaeon AD8-1]|nr:MAG: hypothetical protein AC479_03930 [miscellaneous Crenarchaeota group-6 archaeon AD8-1]
MKSKPRILVVFYSMYGHIFKLAQEVAKGVNEAGGEAIIKQVEELVPEKHLNKQAKQAKEKMKEIEIANPREDLIDIDGVMVGVPTRFGNMCSQMRNFWDQTGSMWGSLIGKPAAVFTSSNTQHGGQETTLITTQITFLHHGCVVVGLPYSFSGQSRMDEITGGSPYGLSTVAGEGPPYERVPTDNELEMAKGYGKYLTNIARKLMK